jgi:hypothetical protein
MNLLSLAFLMALQQSSTPIPAASDATIELENRYVRVARVHYQPHETTAIHDHPATPTVYVYVTDGGRLRIEHQGEQAVIRPPVKAGGIRFQKGVFERHVVEELDGVESEYLRIELKIQPVDLPEKDVRRAPDDRTPYESGMIRILRVTCPPQSACPASEHPENPAVVVTGRNFTWVVPNAPPIKNPTATPLEQVRVELETPPLP